MKKIIIPTICFAVLSTPAFEKSIQAAAIPSNSNITNANQANTYIKSVNVTPGTNLNMRISPSTTSSILTKLARGTQVLVYSESNGWAKIQVNGRDGYVRSEYLANVATASSSEPRITVKYVSVSSGSNLNLRSAASTNSSILAKLTNGTEVSVISEANGWAKVKVNGKEGFVSSTYLVTSNAKNHTNVPENNQTLVTKFVNVSQGSVLNMRSSASTSSSIISKLNRDTELTVISESNGWAKVRVNGKEGFVSSQFLSQNKPGAAPTQQQPIVTTTKYVNVSSGSSLNMRKSASSSASVITKLARGVEVIVYSESNGWAKVRAYGQEGYVSIAFLTSTKPGTEKPTPPAQVVEVKKFVNITSTSSLNLRSSASSSATVIGKLSRGTEVVVLSELSSWTKVRVDGKEGFVSSKYLSSEKPGVAEKEEPITEEIENKTTQYVNVSLGSSLNMRTSPSISASILVKIARGVEVQVYSESNGWAKIHVYGHDGYVNSSFLSTTKPVNPGTEPPKQEDSHTQPEENKQPEPNNEPAPNPQPDSEADPSQNPQPDTNVEPSPAEQEGVSDTVYKYVDVASGSNLNMRSAASTTATIITRLGRGTVVTVLSEENGWAKVAANGHTGFVSSQFLSSSVINNPGSLKGTISQNFASYDITLDRMTNLQMAVLPQTDRKYATYIREDALVLNHPETPTNGTVKGTWNVRGGAGTNFWVVGQVTNGQTLQIVSAQVGSDGHMWYQVQFNKSWVNASPEDVKYYLNPSNFINSSVESLQFLKLSETTNLDISEVNQKILTGKGILSGQAAAFITAGELFGVNEVYLIAHALLETGNGASQLARGVEINGQVVYNMYGIGAFDGTAVQSGAEYAYKAGWFTPELAIIGGAQFISQGYINKGQDTIYKMRWNPNGAVLKGVATHQYATDIGWASKQVRQIYNLYSLLDSYHITLEIPQFK